MKRQLLLFALFALVAADAAARSTNVAAAFGQLGVVTSGLGGRAVIFLLGFGALAVGSAGMRGLRETLRRRRERRAPDGPARTVEASTRAPARAPGLPG